MSSGTDHDEKSLSSYGNSAALVMESDESSSPSSTASLVSQAVAGITPVPPATASYRRKPRSRPSKLSVEDFGDDDDDEEEAEVGEEESDFQNVTRHDVGDVTRNGTRKGLQNSGGLGPLANGGGLENGAIEATTLGAAPVTAASVESGAAHEDYEAQTGSRLSGVRSFASLVRTCVICLPRVQYFSASFDVMWFRVADRAAVLGLL